MTVSYASHRRRRRRRARSRARCCPWAWSSSSPSRSRSGARGFRGIGPLPGGDDDRAREFREEAPRFASAAPFLCLIDRPLAMPGHATPLLPGPGRARARACRRSAPGGTRRPVPALAHEHGVAVVLGEHLDVGACGHDAGARMKTPRSGTSSPASRGPPRSCDLAPVGVALDRDVDEPEVVPVEQDHPGAGSEDRPSNRRTGASSP